MTIYEWVYGAFVCEATTERREGRSRAKETNSDDDFSNFVSGWVIYTSSLVSLCGLFFSRLYQSAVGDDGCVEEFFVFSFVVFVFVARPCAF